LIEHSTLGECKTKKPRNGSGEDYVKEGGKAINKRLRMQELNRPVLWFNLPHVKQLSEDTGLSGKGNSKG